MIIYEVIHFWVCRKPESHLWCRQWLHHPAGCLLSSCSWWETVGKEKYGVFAPIHLLAPQFPVGEIGSQRRISWFWGAYVTLSHSIASPKSPFLLLGYYFWVSSQYCDWDLLPVQAVPNPSVRCFYIWMLFWTTLNAKHLCKDTTVDCFPSGILTFDVSAIGWNNPKCWVVCLFVCLEHRNSL